MLWSVAAPFFGSEQGDRWLDDLVGDSAHHFRKIAADRAGGATWHERAARATPASQWLRYWTQAARALDEGDGVVTVFPQLAMAAAVRRHYRRGTKPIVAWCFNLGRFPRGAKGHIAAHFLRSIDRFVVHSRGEVALLRDWLDLDERRVRFVPLQRAAIPVLASEDAEQPFAVAMGSANRDYATLFEAARRTGFPFTVVAAPHALPPSAPPANVRLLTGLDTEACLVLAQRARLSIVPLADVAAASGQITIVEAMRMGRPLIATDSIGTIDYVADGETGLLVPPNDPAALAVALEQLWHDGALRSRIGRSAARFAEQNLSDEAAAGAFRAILDELA